MLARESSDRPFLNLRDYERAARRLTPLEAWDFLQGGSDGEFTLRQNVAAFRKLWLRPRVLAGVGQSDLSTSLLGTDVRSPLMLAPVALQKLFHPEGELGSARAAAELGMLCVVSMMSSVPLRELALLNGRFWLQLYFLKDRLRMLDVIRTAEELQCAALVLTVDTPRIGKRERDLRNEFHLPDTVRAALVGNDSLHSPRVGRSAIATHATEYFEDRLDWTAIEWLRAHTRLPIVLKGLARPGDVTRAAAEGVAGVIVSNHGGRQLDSVRASIQSLAEIASSTPPGCELYLDGGVRRGTDVLKAGALGARGVMIGRPFIWGLIVAGSDGVRDALSLLHAELELAMTLAGCARWSELDRSWLSSRPPFDHLAF